MSGPDERSEAVRISSSESFICAYWRTLRIQLKVPSLLLLLVLVCHGLLLFDRSVDWDGWIFYGLFLDHDAGTVAELFRENGNPLAAPFFTFFWWFPDPLFAYKLFAFLCIFFSALITYFLAQRVRVFSSNECLFIAALSCCYTGYQTYAQIATLHYIFSYTLFLLAAYLSLHTFGPEREHAFLWRILSLTLFFCSFQVGSFLVFYFPFLMLVLVERRQQWGKSCMELLSSALKYMDFYTLPFVFWLLKNISWKPYGAYAGYNALKFNPHDWYPLLHLFFDNSVFLQFARARELVLGYPKISVLFGIVFIIVERILNGWHHSQKDNEQPPIHHIKVYRGTGYIALYGFFLLICAVLPYVVVGKAAGSDGSDTRHALLISLPIAILLVAVGRVFALLLPRMVSYMVLYLTSISLIVAFTLSTLTISMAMQSRWIKNLSIIHNLKKLPRDVINKVRIILVSDPNRFGDSYDPYEYSGMFKLAWGAERWTGLELIDSESASIATRKLERILRRNSLRVYLARDLPKHGCQVVLNIKTTVPESYKLVMSYFKDRWFEPASLPAFLEKLTKLKMTDFSCKE